MHGSVGQAQDNDVAIVIYQSTDREGSTFSLSPNSRRRLAERFGTKFRMAPRIFIAHAPQDASARFHGSHVKQLVALLTGLDDDLLAHVGDIEFRDPVTDQRL